MRVKAVQPLLIQARSIIEREEHEASTRQAKLEQEERLRQAKLEEEARLAREQAEHEESIRREQEIREERIRHEQAEREANLERLRLEHEERMARLQAEQEERIRLAKLEEEERLRQIRKPKETQRTSQDDGSEESLLKGLQGKDTVTVEQAAQVLGHEDTRYVVRLRNEGTLKHKPKHEDLITVASLRAYLATHKRRTPTTEKLEASRSNGHAKETVTPDEYPEILV